MIPETWRDSLLVALQKPSVMDVMFPAEKQTRMQRIRSRIGGWLHAIADHIDRRGYWERY